MKLRPRPEWGTIPWQPQRYGTSNLGLPLEVWTPRGECRLLIHAGIHGEEPETTYALSRALRQMPARPEHTAVVLAANPDGLVRGTRGNARGVDLNRNFPSKDWRAGTVTHRSTIEDESDILLGTGDAPLSEPESRALVDLIADLAPQAVVALHAPLACIDDANDTPFGQRIARLARLPLVTDVGYPTPGSFGSWGSDNGLPVVTYEFPLAATEVLMREHVPVLVELLADPGL
jgi:protein MpaA